MSCLGAGGADGEGGGGGGGGGEVEKLAQQLATLEVMLVLTIHVCTGAGYLISELDHHI